MQKKLSLTFFFGFLIFFYSCSQFTRLDPDPLYLCIDSFPIAVNKSDKGPGYKLSEKQLEAIEFCLKRS